MASSVRKKRGKVLPSTKKELPSISKPLISDAKLKQLYSTMLHCRILVERADTRRGVSGKSAPLFGGEAAAVGTALDMRRDDWLAPLRNDVVGRFLKGMPLASIFSEFHLDDAGNPSGAHATESTTIKEDHSLFHILPGAANPAAQLNLAAGVALALQAKRTRNIVMAFCGDISASRQRWQEALNFAARNCLPLLVVVQINSSAKAASAKEGKSSVSLLSEGNPCELPVIPVDADDVVAIYRVAYESIHKARHGGGPTLIQAISFFPPRGGERHVAEHPDAIARMEDYLSAKGLFSQSWKQKLIDSFNRDVDSALKTQKKPRLRNRE